MSATRNPLVNWIITLLVAVSLALLCIPCYVTENDSASVMSYILTNTDHEDVTGLFKQANPEFLLNGQVWMPILMFLFGLVTIFMMVSRRNLTSTLWFPLIYSVFGIFVVWTNELTRLGGVTLQPTLILLAILALCLYNGCWFSGYGEDIWKKDPAARSKLKEITKAAEKKNVSILQSHAQSVDLTVRTTAIEGLAQVGGNAAFQPLIAQLSCSHPDVRIAAAKALGTLGDTRGRSFLLHYMESDPDSRVRAAMRQALSQLPSHAE